MTINKRQPQTAGPSLQGFNGLTQFDRGIIDRTLGRPMDVETLDDDEATEYRRGYESVQ